jgi:hypothetical protein
MHGELSCLRRERSARTIAVCGVKQVYSRGHTQIEHLLQATMAQMSSGSRSCDPFLYVKDKTDWAAGQAAKNVAKHSTPI